MKFSPAGSLLLLAAGIAVASSQTPTPPAQPAAPPPAADQAPTPAQPGGKVIFSRSTDENGQTTTQAGPAAAPPPIKIADAPTAEDAERQAVTFTGFDLDVRLRPAEQHIAVRALLTLRNDGTQPLAHIPLQISSSLNWERIRLIAPAGQLQDIAFPVAILNSDSDHTGQLHEAAVPLAEPLAPGATVQLDVTYSGPIAANARRLLAIGTPGDLALHSDWDQIGPDFTGLRGFGNVVWYPVSSVPVILGDGARLFDQIGQHKLRLAGARFRLRLTVEFPPGRAPSVALINGHPTPLAVTNPGDLNQEVSGVATAGNDGEILGFEAPSLFVAIRTPRTAANTTLWAIPENDSALQGWSRAATAVTPFLEGWLGPHPRSQLTLLDLPDPQDAPYETGAMLATALRPAPPEQLEGVLVHALTHAWMDSPRAWLSEGVANFMGALWIEKQRGRSHALESLEASRAALALAEPESPGQSPGQPLAQAVSPVYYRTKAAYVFWMLREIAGDAALSAALQAYDPVQDIAGDKQEAAKIRSDSQPCQGTTSVVPKMQQNEHGALAPEGCVSENSVRASARSSFEQLLEASGAHRDLSWFFADWVNADKGLPDLAISSVYPTPEQAGNWLVTVNIANNGYAAAEVPVTVRSFSNSVTQRVLVPARGKAAQRLLILGKPLQVEVNDGVTPETTAAIHITHLDQPAPSSSAQPDPGQPQP